MFQPSFPEVQDAFLAAMANGYAQGAPKTFIPGLPGSHAVHFEHGDFKVMDVYFTNPDSDRSAGHTTIWHDNVPVWTMSYGGEYPEIVVPFLKECLHKAYVVDRQFYGGRGPHFMRSDRFAYVNRIRNNNWFPNFEGEESIFDLNEEHRCGYHWYKGMSLLRNN